MLHRFKSHLEENFSELKNGKLLLAVSGGVDSMVFYHLLWRLDYEPSLAHCNFKLRGTESDQDEAFLKTSAAVFKSQLFCKSFDTMNFANNQKVSVQMAARELRYSWFQELLENNAFDFLLTAHHADDNIETFLINLSRGTGLDGLTGIPPKSGKIRRPLLPFSKDEILTYAKEHGIKWRDDSSNLDHKYLRNKIRADLIPLLKEINPSFLESFRVTLDNLMGTQQIVKDRMNTVLESIVEKHEDPTVLAFNVGKLSKFSDNLSYYYQIFSPFGFNQLEDISALLSAQPGKQLRSKTHRLLKDREVLLLSPILDENETDGPIFIDHSDKRIEKHNLIMEFDTLDSIDLSPFLNKSETAFFDKKLLTFPLSVRKWEKGDYFYPIGMKGKKKLSKFFKDEKYSLLQKENIWLLCSGQDIVWVIGKRMDDRYKITDKTTHILKATVKT